MKNKLLWFVTILPAIITAIVIQFMEDDVPMHYNASGEIDRWGSKYENFTFPAIIVLFTLFWIVFMNYYRKKANNSTEEKTIKEAENNLKVLNVVAIAMAAMFGIMQCVFLFMAINASKDEGASLDIDTSAITNIVMGVFIIIIGNIVPKAKRNATVGIRTVWSMENDETWAESNRIGGIILVIAGILIIIESAIAGGLASTFIMLGIIIAATILSVIFSYKAYKKYK